MIKHIHKTYYKLKDLSFEPKPANQNKRALTYLKMYYTVNWSTKKQISSSETRETLESENDKEANTLNRLQIKNIDQKILLPHQKQGREDIIPKYVEAQ